MLKIALVAHDEKKPEMIEFAKTHQDILSQCELKRRNELKVFS